MSVRYSVLGDITMIADDPNTIYVFRYVDYDEVRLVGKNGCDIVTFYFKNGIVTINGH